MPSLIKLDMESSLFIELKIALADIGCFIGLTPAGKLSNQFGVVTRWIQIGDEARHMTNSNNLAQEDTAHSLGMKDL